MNSVSHPPASIFAASLAAALLALLSLAAAGCGASAPPLPIVSIAPQSVTLQAGGGQQQFTAMVTNTSNHAVVWKVNGHLNGDPTTGTISQTGLYQAPADVPAGGSVTVEAMSVENDNATASAVVKLTPGVTISLTPATVTLGANGTQQFQATVTNTSNPAVTWTVNNVAGGNATVGTISSTGLYTAPATFPGLSQVIVTATSAADPSVSAQATVTLSQTVAVTVSPASASVAISQNASFTATVTGAADPTVTWSVAGIAGGNATVGTITPAGVFTAPATIPNPATETITATSNADKNKTASAQVTITPPVTVSITPATAQVAVGATQPFTANVTNATNGAVTWAVNGTPGGNSIFGTISSSGVYTAPATPPGTQTITVTATSVADPGASASATVTVVVPLVVTISPTSATVNLEATQPFQATVTGGDGSNTAVTWSVNGTTGGNATLGTITTAGVFTAPSQMPSNPKETITATSQADATKSASATVTLQVPPSAFTLTPASSTLSLGKAQQGTVTLQLSLSAGFTNPVQFAVTGLPVNVTSTVTPAPATASGPVQVTLATAPISLAATSVPVVVTATSKDTDGNPIVQTATIALTITGWAGHVSTLAGTPGGPGFEDGSGTQDALYATGIVSDGGQNLFFSDKSGHALRQYNLTNHGVSTLIGGPYNYTFGEGDGMAYNPDNGTVYVADSLKNQVFAYRLGSGDTLTVVAGSGTAGAADGVGAAASFDSPHGLALSSDHATLYVADSSNGLIRAITLATGAVTTIAGQPGVFRSTDGVGAKASFCEPTGLAIDPAGANLYISDQCDYVIRQLNLATAQVTTVAGSGQQGMADGPAATATFNDLNGLAVDPHAAANTVYITDRNAIRALRLGANPVVYTVAGSSATGFADGSSGEALFDRPTALTALADLNGSGTTSLFVADSLNGVLRRVDVTNPLTATSDTNVQAQISTIAGQPAHDGSADGTTTGADYSGTSSATFNQPEGIVTDGKIAYLADSANGAVRKIDLSTGQVSTVAGPHLGYTDGPAASAAFFDNAGIAWVPSQNVLYLTDTGNGVIRKLDLATQTVSTIAGNNTQYGYVDGPLAQARFNHPFGILASADGTKLYVADTGNNAIRLIDLTQGTVSTIAGGKLGDADGVGTAARFSEPNGLAWDATQQNIYITDFETADIRELNLATGNVTTIVGMNHVCGHADGPATSATLCDPAFLASDGHSLFWGDSGMGLLRVMDLTTGQVYTLAGSPGVMHAADGDFTETAGHLTGPVQYNDPFGIALAPDGSFVLITDKNENVVRIIH